MRNFGTKTDNTAPAAGGVLTAAEDNNRFTEMKGAVTSAGITLDGATGPDTDTTMLSQATARYASGGTWYQDTSVSANTLTLSTPASYVMPKAYFTGMLVRCVVGNTNTGDTQANVNSIGLKAVRTFADTALVGGELVSGRPTAWIYSTTADGGAGAWLILPWANAQSDNLITTSITRTVHGPGANFANLHDAFEWLSRHRITTTGSVEFVLAAGVGGSAHSYTAHLLFDHPDGARVTIRGQALAGVYPVAADYAVTGNGSTPRAADRATNLTMLRTRFATEISFSSGFGFFIRSNLGGIQNLLLVAASASSGIPLSVSYSTPLTQIVAVGGASHGIVLQRSASVLVTGGIAGIGGGGHGISNSGNMRHDGATVFGFGNGQTGLSSSGGAVVSDSGGAIQTSGNASSGALASHCGSIVGQSIRANTNGFSGIDARSQASISVDYAEGGNNVYAAIYTQGGHIRMAASAGTGNVWGYSAFDNGFISRGTASATGTSGVSTPAVNTLGNNTALIV